MFDSEKLQRALFAHTKSARAFAVAYSGGRDSSVLLHALLRAREQCDFSLRALHFSHGLQKESVQWAAHCKTQCEKWRIECAHAGAQLQKTPGRSVEADARAARYRWFAECVARGEILLTAHHADDQLETVLLNVLRGGGVHSLGGIAPLRMLCAQKQTQVARPLLEFSRAELAAYARRHNLQWVHDSSNDDAQFERNFLRHAVIPLLHRRRSGVTASVARAAQNCRDAARILDATLLPLLRQCESPAARGVFCVTPPLDAHAFRAHGIARAPALLRLWLHRCGRRSPSHAQLKLFCAQLFAARHATLRAAEIELHFFHGRIYMTAPLGAALQNHAAVEWDLRARELQNGVRIAMRAGENHSPANLSPQKLHGKKLQLMWRAGGERMVLPGRNHSSALKKLFQQRHVPPWERRALPLLVVDGEIAWAHGVGAAAACAARGGGVRPSFATQSHSRAFL